MTETDETLYWKKTINQHQYICNTCKDACHASCIKSQPFLVSMPKVSKIHSWLCQRRSLAELPRLLTIVLLINLLMSLMLLSILTMKGINGYYNNNLTIAHLNVNSIYGKSDEVINHTRQLCF